jgi:O-antigen/teichoic acid export membrane protein
MSIWRNLFAFSASQFYVTLIGLIMLPLYIRYMGVEAYGLVGFFVMLQAWFQLLDVGLSPTMARETARHRGEGASGLGLRDLLRSLEGVFFGVALLGALFLILGANRIAESWLNAEQLTKSEVAETIKLMALVIALRWVGELYRGVISGFEQMVWLGGFNVAIATVRFVFVIPLFIWISNGVEAFFVFQLCVAAAEAALLAHKAYALLPRAPDALLRWSWKPLRKVFQFSALMALANLVWISVSQADKLLLSAMLGLADYGRFTLSVLAAGGLLILASPIITVLMPRLTVLCVQGDEEALLSLYRRATQWVGLLAWSACGVLAWQAERVLWIWTGDASLASQAAPVLRLYALGNGAMALGAFPYYLQFARGHLRLHLLGTFLFVLILVPCLVLGTSRLGAVGAGWAWLAVNAAYFLVWVPVAHAKYAPGLHGRWLFHDVAPIALLALTAALASRWLPWPQGRAMAGFELFAVFAGVLMFSAMGSSSVRGELTAASRSWRPVRQQ